MKSTVQKVESLQMTVDRFGRVIIPQQVREELRLGPGSKLEIVKKTEQSLVLQPVHEVARLEWIHGVPVLSGKGPPIDIDPVDLIKADREARDKKIWDGSQ